MEVTYSKLFLASDPERASTPRKDVLNASGRWPHPSGSSPAHIPSTATSPGSVSGQSHPDESMDSMSSPGPPWPARMTASPGAPVSNNQEATTCTVSS